MINCFRRKIRVPLVIVLFFVIIFTILFYKHIRNVHQKRDMLNRFLFYKQFLYDVKLNVNDLKKKINQSEINVKKLSKVLTVLYDSASSNNNNSFDEVKNSNSIGLNIYKPLHRNFRSWIVRTRDFKATNLEI